MEAHDRLGLDAVSARNGRRSRSIMRRNDRHAFPVTDDGPARNSLHHHSKIVAAGRSLPHESAMAATNTTQQVNETLTVCK